ncbi:MAG: hypothetical protein P8Y80_09865 [Acidobacteriota bacterium]
MKDKSSTKLSDKIKSCLYELDFHEMDEISENDSLKLITGVQDDALSVLMEIDCQLKTNAVNLRLIPSLEFKSSDMLAFYQLINTLNGTLMDIGHFSINESDKGFLLQTSIDYSAGIFDREQMIESIKRIVQQGLEGFKLLMEMLNGDQCPYQMLASYMTEMRENLQQDEKIIH